MTEYTVIVDEEYSESMSRLQAIRLAKRKQSEGHKVKMITTYKANKRRGLL